ncbi:MAG: ABC transporter substrate-binding protein [Promethearchaeota archaeon]
MKIIKICAIAFLALFLVLPANPIMASMTSVEAPQQDTLVILHPHSADFAGHVISGFRSWYEGETGHTIAVDTIEKSSYSCYLAVAGWDGAPEADIWWGGGEGLFEDAREGGWLSPYEVAEDENITDYLWDGGWHLKDDSGDFAEPVWYGAAISGFGIMYNTEVLLAEGISVPETWDDLVKKEYYGQIIMADPAESGSTTAAVEMVLADKNDETDAANLSVNADLSEGWAYWAKVAGNVGEFTASSSAVPSAVYEGTYGVAITIDYYAWAKIAISVPGAIGFNYGGASTFSPDPVAILDGATHQTPAEAFMDYVMSTEGQSRVGRFRIPVNKKAVPESKAIPRAYGEDGQINPEFPLILPFNVSLDGDMKTPTRNLCHYWFVVNHDKAVAAYDAILKATDATAKSNALNLYTKLPSNFDGTALNLTQQDTTEAAVTGLWSSEGAANFDAAKAEAVKIYETGTAEPTGETSEEEASSSEEGTQQVPGFEALIFLAMIGTLVIWRRKKR